MTKRSLQRTLFLLLGISASVAVALGVYMAQPWGDNYAYQDASGYLVLGGLLLFSVSPLAGLAMLSRLVLRSAVSHVTFVVGACGIGIAGSLAYCNAAFVHVDAQGGLVFLSVPLLQWLATLVLLAICGLVVRLSRPAAARKE